MAQAKLGPKTQTTPDSDFIRERRSSDHGLSLLEGKTQTIVRVWGVFLGRARQGALKVVRKIQTVCNGAGPI